MEGIFRSRVQELISNEGAQLVEVLPREEFEWGHLAGAVNLPLKELDASAVSRLDPQRPVIAYCNDFL